MFKCEQKYEWKSVVDCSSSWLLHIKIKPVNTFYYQEFDEKNASSKNLALVIYNCCFKLCTR